MALPPRLKKEPKPGTRWKSPAHRDHVRSFQCSMPGCKGMPIEAAHVKMGEVAGMGLKGDDWRCVPLCQFHHRHDQHVKGEPSFWADYEKVAGQTVWDLIDDLCASSPKSAEIRKVRAERLVA